jgi:hypothetical protein
VLSYSWLNQLTEWASWAASLRQMQSAVAPLLHSMNQVVTGSDRPQQIRAVVGFTLGPLGPEPQVEGHLLHRIFELGGVLGVEDKIVQHRLDADDKIVPAGVIIREVFRGRP